MGSPAFIRIRGEDPQQSRAQDNISQQLQPIAVALAKTPIMGAPSPTWIAPTLLNGFTATLGGYAAPGYHRNALNYVYLQGSITNTTAGILVQGTNLFVLPAGYRPSGTLRFPAYSTSVVSVSLDISGNLTVLMDMDAAQQIDLHFSFLALA